MARLPERFRSCLPYRPATDRQAAAWSRVADDCGPFANGTGPYSSLYLMGAYGSGKTHFAAAQYATLVAQNWPVYWTSMAELLAEFRQAEMDSEFYSAARDRARHWEKCHFFVDDIDKFKVTEFKFEVLFDFFDTLYKRKLRLTATSNLTLRQLVEMERLHPAIVRRIDDMCRVVEL